MPPTGCVCRHSYTAHVVGSSKGCSFCACQEYKDPAEAVAEKQAGAPLSEAALKALEVMAKNPTFQHVAPDHLREFARHGKRRLFLSQATVMMQGGESSTLHVLLKGHVRVRREIGGSGVHPADLGPGDVIGEMGVLNGDPRSATVTALEDLETLELEAPFLKQIFQDDPDVLMAVMKVINERLKNTDELIENSVKVALTQLGTDA